MNGSRRGAGNAADVKFATARRRALQTFERLYVVCLLRRHGGNVERAAHRAGISPTALRALIKRDSIDLREYLPQPRPVLVVAREPQDNA